MAVERITLAEVSDQTEDGQKLYLQTVLKNEGQEGFELLLLDGNNVWEGQVTEDDLDGLSEKSKLDYNTYVSETKAAFTRDKTTNSNFECHWKKNSEDTSILIWKKVSARDVKYNLGSVTLKKCKNSSENLSKVLSHCISQTGLLQEEIHKLQAANKRLSLERSTALQKLEKSVVAKEDVEHNLFSKFVTVLNSKKEKIRQLENLEGEPPAEDPSLSSTSKDKRTNSKKKNEEDRDDWNRSTSEDSLPDSEESPVKKKRTRSKVVELESSLNLEEEGEKQPEPPVARRPRRKTAIKKTTSSKPVLPRVSSGDSAERPNSARSGLRKSNSANSNKSSDNLDTDDLLINF
ncbi:unnamed protein product [Lymnaea stagnalis]|uniref:DNA repair protein XRCC4 n=1 Tax=Lymnaea stagnalis TaxID=6523 RepID=A0AAV2H9U8_LYMST